MHLPKYTANWILYLPNWVRRNPLGMFLALLCVITGLLYVFNLATNNVITNELNRTWLQCWGAYLAIGGLVKIYGNVACNYPAEKLGCRLISVALIVYAAWLITLVGFRATTSVALSLILIFSLEARVAVINLILSPVKTVQGGRDVINPSS